MRSIWMDGFDFAINHFAKEIVFIPTGHRVGGQDEENTSPITTTYLTSHLLLVLSAPLYRLVPATGVSPDTVWAEFSGRVLLARMVHPTTNCQGSLPRGRPYSRKCVCYRLFVLFPEAFNLHIHAHTDCCCPPLPESSGRLLGCRLIVL